MDVGYPREAAAKAMSAEGEKALIDELTGLGWKVE